MFCLGYITIPILIPIFHNFSTWLEDKHCEAVYEAPAAVFFMDDDKERQRLLNQKNYKSLVMDIDVSAVKCMHSIVTDISSSRFEKMDAAIKELSEKVCFLIVEEATSAFVRGTFPP